MSETIYRVAAKHSVLGDKGITVYGPGDIVPVKQLFANDPGRVKDLMASGHLTTDLPALAVRNGALETSVVVGQWRVNPQNTLGKNLEQLHIMILEIDSSMKDGLPETEEEARQFLSIDYHPDPD